MQHLLLHTVQPAAAVLQQLIQTCKAHNQCLINYCDRHHSQQSVHMHQARPAMCALVQCTNAGVGLILLRMYHSITDDTVDLCMFPGNTRYCVCIKHMLNVTDCNVQHIVQEAVWCLIEVN